MATIVAEGEKVKQALKWISREREERTGSDLSGLIRDASMRFNLSPKDEEFLYAFFKENAQGDIVR
jgi:hypothetical protein